MVGPTLTIASYLLGSISFGLIIAKRRGVDLRSIGSGNIGSTNVGRALGKPTGRVVLVLDMLKGFLPVALAHWVLDLPWPWITAVGLAAAVGHVFPIWYGFRGGKGAATSGGVLLAALPPIGAVTLLTYVVVKRWTRLASVGSLSAATVGAVLTLVLDGREWPVLLATGLWVLVALRHAGNIVRLLRGEERIG
ncbi:MAG: glycerol-3-phosphate 1-O-acyltransferase PlsY [Deltaproteobacteria bacterium]|nr:glycerol-3-phosphate 1-O-acyltransferase PlsY [Deltaproteobacteria bacterium]